MGFENGIHFALVEKEGPWRDFLDTHFALQSESLEILLNFGAIYRNHKRWSPQENEILQKGDLIRVHKRPRRFAVDRLGASTIRAAEKNWVLIWKPAGVPSHETLDNLIENAKAWTERERKEKLWSLNRLDVGTRGWLLFGRTGEFARDFNIAMQASRIGKFYECLSPKPRAAEDRWRHWMQKSERAPKLISESENPGHTLNCELRFESRAPLANGIQHSRIELITGRTHQIRAQFAFENAPILGDRMYGSVHPSLSTDVDDFALSCEKFEFEEDGKRFVFERNREALSLPEVWLTGSSKK